jgi:hypothetical protein
MYQGQRQQIPRPEQLKSSQMTKTKPTQLTKQEKKQARTNDICGRVLGELEAAIKCSDKNTILIPQHEMYLSVPGKDKFFYLQDIEIMMVALESFCKPKIEKGGLFSSEKVIEKAAELPKLDHNYFEMLDNCLGQLDWNDPVRQVGVHILNCFKTKKPIEVPERLCELVKSSEKRDKEVKFMMNSNQTALIAPSWMAEGIGKGVQENLNHFTPEMAEPQILTYPLYNIKDAPRPREQKWYPK